MAPSRLRGQMLTAVFAFQPLGQLEAALVTLIDVSVARRSIPSDVTQSTCTGDCTRSIDIIWRGIIGFGALLAAVALCFQLTIIESPRYTYEVAQDDLRAVADVDRYYQGSHSSSEVGSHDTDSHNGTLLRPLSTHLEAEDPVQQAAYSNIEDESPREEERQGEGEPQREEERQGEEERYIEEERSREERRGR